MEIIVKDLKDLGINLIILFLKNLYIQNGINKRVLEKMVLYMIRVIKFI